MDFIADWLASFFVFLVTPQKNDSKGNKKRAVIQIIGISISLAIFVFGIYTAYISGHIFSAVVIALFLLLCIVFIIMAIRHSLKKK